MSTQFTAGVREELAEEFGLPLERVRVIVDGMGGGFGSKSSLGGYGRVAVALSRQAGAPVRIVLDRREEQMDAGNRPETWQRLRIGARRDGTLTAISLQSYGSAGVAGRRRRRLFRARTLRLPQLRIPPSTTSSSTPGQDARCAAPAIRRARSRSSRRSTNSPNASAWILWRCASVSTRARCGARNAGSARCSSAGSGGARPAPIRAGQARPRRRPIAVGRQCPNAFVLRSAGRSRRRDRGLVGRAGHRNRHRHGDGADRRRGLWVADRGHRRAHRRHRLSGRVALVRQPRHGLDHAAGARRRMARVASPVARGGADPERRRRRSRRARWAHRGSRRAEPKPRLPRGRDAHERRSDQRHRFAKRRLRRVPAAHAGRRDRRPGSRRRAVRRSRGRHGDGDRARRARRRRAGLRPPDEPAADRKPGAGRRHHGPFLRLV